MNVYKKAAQILRERGWVPGSLGEYSENGPMCINGALLRAANFPVSYGTYSDPDYTNIVVPICRYLGKSDWDAVSLEIWNDMSARDQREVLEVLEAVGDQE